MSTRRAAGLMSLGLAALASGSCTPERRADTAREETAMVEVDDGRIEVHLRGEGPPVVVIPSFGRGAADFDALGRELVTAGYRVVAPEPRGVGRSEGRMTGLTLHDLAADVAAVIEATDSAPASIVGHAFGNRIARALATDRPELVRELILLGAGGWTQLSAELQKDLAAALDPGLAPEPRLAAIGRAFFAPGRDASGWLDGWHPETASAQYGAQEGVAVEEWWAGGSAPMLVLQAADDVLAPRENSERLRAAYPDRVRLIEIPAAGHAMLPEQPELIARTILDHLRDD